MILALTLMGDMSQRELSVANMHAGELYMERLDAVWPSLLADRNEHMHILCSQRLRFNEKVINATSAPDIWRASNGSVIDCDHLVASSKFPDSITQGTKASMANAITHSRMIRAATQKKASESRFSRWTLIFENDADLHPKVADLSADELSRIVRGVYTEADRLDYSLILFSFCLPTIRRRPRSVMCSRVTTSAQYLQRWPQLHICQGRMACATAYGIRRDHARAIIRAWSTLRSGRTDCFRGLWSGSRCLQDPGILGTYLAMCNRTARFQGDRMPMRIMAGECNSLVVGFNWIFQDVLFKRRANLRHGYPQFGLFVQNHTKFGSTLIAKRSLDKKLVLVPTKRICSRDAM